MTEFEKKQTMTYESRIALVKENFCKQMGLLYQPHTHLKEGDAAGIYMQEVAEAINSRISADVPNNDSYKDLLRSIWRAVTGKHKSRFWFNLADIISATNKANRAWEARNGKRKATKVFQGEAGADKSSGVPWTLEGAKKALADTDRMIASGELARGMGEILRKIPLKAIERCGGDANIAPPAKQATPKEHLPDDSGAINMDLIKAGHTAPKFDPFDLAHDDLPDQLRPTVPSLDSL